MSIIPDSLIIYPNAPPAPVINKIPNEFFKDLIIHCGVLCISSFFKNIKVIIKPINKAISGFPIISKIFKNGNLLMSSLGYLIIVEVDMSRIGTITGKKETMLLSEVKS